MPTWLLKLSGVFSVSFQILRCQLRCYPALGLLALALPYGLAAAGSAYLPLALGVVGVSCAGLAQLLLLAPAMRGFWSYAALAPLPRWPLVLAGVFVSCLLSGALAALLLLVFVPALQIPWQQPDYLNLARALLCSHALAALLAALCASLLRPAWLRVGAYLALCAAGLLPSALDLQWLAHSSNPFYGSAMLMTQALGGGPIAAPLWQPPLLALGGLFMAACAVRGRLSRA